MPEASDDGIDGVPVLRSQVSEVGLDGCCICGLPRTSEDEPCLRMGLGALFFYDAAFQTGGPREEMGGFWSLQWHDRKGPPKLVTLAEDVVGGQMEYFFCSPSCLRVFFGRILDRLE